MITTATVLGAGTMGAQIAAHLANAGVPVLLLDVTADAAAAGLARARKLKPDPFFLPDTASLVRTGSFDEQLRDPGGSDGHWVIEAVVERLEIKQALLARLEPHLGPGAIVSTNTSAIPIHRIAEGLTLRVRRRFLGTHFFNPPRYLPLVELIPTTDTDADVVQTLRGFLDLQLGKGVVVAHDRPGFIANRIGVYGMARTLDVVADGRFTVDEVDALTGVAIGRPKSATFRTADIAGLDVLAMVARDLETSLKEEAFRLAPFVETMVGEGAVGEKAGRGFFQKTKGPSGSEIHVRDITTGAYRPRTKPKFASLETSRSIEDVRARLKALFFAQDRAGEFLRHTLGSTLLYSARVAPEIASSIDDIDRAMQWGFGWELGPFEILDTLGLREVLGALDVSTESAPELIADALAAGRNTLRDGPLPPLHPDYGLLRTARVKGSTVVRSNAAASIIDLGDGVLAVALHSKMNAIGGDTMEMLQAGVAEASRGHIGLVVGTEGPHFSAGANLLLLLLAAQEGEWDDIDLMVRSFQRATMTLKTSPVPVVCAVGGLALGGGCEIALHCDRVQAAAEAYIGLVEVSVGLIPAGGGTKEMLARAMDGIDPSQDLLPAVQRVFETIGFAKTSTSALEARRLGYLRDRDGITMNRERLVADAKRFVLARSQAGYQPPVRRAAIPVGGPDVQAALLLGIHLAHRAGRISDHDAAIGRHLARILSGGDVRHKTTISEDQLLDLEREAFLKLSGERKTLERIGYTLKHGKPLRN